MRDNDTRPITAGYIYFLMFVLSHIFPVDELKLSCLPPVQKPQNGMVIPLEASYWHLQGISSHDFLLKVWVVKDNQYEYLEKLA